MLVDLLSGDGGGNFSIIGGGGVTSIIGGGRISSSAILFPLVWAIVSLSISPLMGTWFPL